VDVARCAPEADAKLPQRAPDSDYRDVGNHGCEDAVQWTMSWLDGRNVYSLTSVQPNVRIEAARFPKPAAR